MHSDVSARPSFLSSARLIGRLSLISLLTLSPLSALAQEERATEKAAVEKARQEAAAKQQASLDAAKQDDTKKPDDEKAEDDKKSNDPMSSATFNGLKLRSIGPAFTSGRVIGFAVDPNNASRYYVAAASGGGWKTKNNSQRSVSYGNGIYRSDDGGKSWKNLGLKTSEHIGRIAIDPRDSEIVYVAAQGPLW